MTVIESLLHSVINVNILISLWSFFLIKGLILINDVVHSTIFMLKLTVDIVVILIVFKLIKFNFIIINSDLLRVVKSVFIFISLIVQWLRAVWLSIQIQIDIFIYRLKRLMWGIISLSLWSHSHISRFWLIAIRWGVLNY